MTQVKSAVRLVLLLWAALLWAGDTEPEIYGVFHEAARITPVAPGSVILIFSGTMAVGATTPRQAPNFPLATNLAGTSVRVTVGTSTLDAFVLATEEQW